MKLEYTKEDEKNMREAMDAVLDDLKALYGISGSLELSTSFYLSRPYSGQYNLCINKKKICFCNADTSGHIILERTSGLVKRPAIKDPELMFAFLRDYDKIREKIEEEAKSNAESKEYMTQTLLDLKNRYSRESTIEVELEETNNPRSIEIKEENGSTIGEFRFGRDTIRIITNGNIVVVKKEEETKKR